LKLKSTLVHKVVSPFLFDFTINIY